MRIITAIVLASLAIAAPTMAQEVGNDDATFKDGILVTSGDILTCPYRVAQPVTVNVTEDYNAHSRVEIFDKLRDAARLASADAVVHVEKGKGHMTMFAFSRRQYTGRAIRFVDRSCAPKQ